MLYNYMDAWLVLPAIKNYIFCKLGVTEKFGNQILKYFMTVFCQLIVNPFISLILFNQPRIHQHH